MYSPVGGAEQCVNNAACISVVQKNAPTPTHAHRLYVLPHCKSCLYSNIYTHQCKHKACAFLFLFLFSQTDSDSGCKMKLGLQLRHPVHSGRLAQNASTARGKSHKKPLQLPLLLAAATLHSAMCLHICIWDTAASILCLRNEL